MLTTCVKTIQNFVSCISIEMVFILIEGRVYFAASDESSAGAIVLFKPYPALTTYNAEFMTLAVW